MRKMLIMLVVLLITSLSYAGDNQISTITPEIKVTGRDRDKFTQIICVDGYKYLVFYHYQGVSITQMMKDGKGKSNIPQPVKCNE